MDQFDNAGRFSIGPVYRANGELGGYMVWDGAYLPPVVVKDYRRKNRVNWKGTKEEAEHLCALLNTNVRKLGNVSIVSDATELSSSQKIMYVNKAKRKASNFRGGSGLSVVSRDASFTKCSKCGRMVKKGHDCER